jgi:hypothetical protein
VGATGIEEEDEYTSFAALPGLKAQVKLENVIN